MVLAGSSDACHLTVRPAMQCDKQQQEAWQMVLQHAFVASRPPPHKAIPSALRLAFAVLHLAFQSISNRWLLPIISGDTSNRWIMQSGNTCIINQKVLRALQHGYLQRKCWMRWREQGLLIEGDLLIISLEVVGPARGTYLAFPFTGEEYLKWASLTTQSYIVHI